MPSGRTVAEGLATRKDNFLLLRVIAALMVIYGHSFALSPIPGARDIFLRLNWDTYSGDIAVDIFFVLSGFMVSGSYLRRSDPVDYLKARLLRIVPALLACLIVTAFVIGPILTSLSLTDYLRSHDVTHYVVQNLKFSSAVSYALPGVFQSNPFGPSVNGSLWTLPAEFHMYLFVAVIGAVGLFRSRKLTLLVLAGLALAGIFRPELLPLHWMWVRLAGYFLLGIVIQLYKDRIEISHVGMLALLFATYLCRRAEIYPWVFALALTYFCFWFGYCVRLPSIEKYGDPSYGAYLWGWPLQQVYAAVFPHAAPLLSFLVCGCAALTLGYLSWHTVERQALRLKSIRLWPLTAPATTQDGLDRRGT